jgi:hypothetical protein
MAELQTVHIERGMRATGAALVVGAMLLVGPASIASVSFGDGPGGPGASGSGTAAINAYRQQVRDAISNYAHHPGPAQLQNLFTNVRDAGKNLTWPSTTFPSTIVQRRQPFAENRVIRRGRASIYRFGKVYLAFASGLLNTVVVIAKGGTFR